MPVNENVTVQGSLFDHKDLAAVGPELGIDQ